ncbi:MAG TPA: hypothetical protein VGM91_21570 [Conexibacter sp.]
MASSLVSSNTTAGAAGARILLTRLPSLAELYNDPRRLRSRELDLGLRWRARDGTTYRAAWIEETEELYAVQHLDHDGHGGCVRILGHLPARRLQWALRGWPEQCGRPASYEWLCCRVGMTKDRELPQTLA